MMRAAQLFIEPIRQLLGGSRVGVAAAQPASGPTQAQTTRQPSGLVSRLKEDSGTAVVAGSVQILGLGHLKDRLGPKWTNVSQRAIRIAQEVLDEHLEAGDVYRPLGEDAFQICFATSDHAYATHQVRRAAAAIELRFLDEVGADRPLSVDTFVASVPRDQLRDSPDLMSALQESLLEIRRQSDAGAERELSIRALRQCSAHFQPLWSNGHFAGTKNRCVLAAASGPLVARAMDAFEDYGLGEVLPEIDGLIFAKSVESLHKSIRQGIHASILVPVHFYTLRSGHSGFLDLTASLPDEYRRYVTVDVVGIDASVGGEEILEVAEIACSVGDEVVLQIPPFDPRLAQVGDLINGVSIALGDLPGDDTAIEDELKRFTACARKMDLLSFAYTANTIGKAAAAAHAGFDYLSGTAVHATVFAPRSAAPFSPLFGAGRPWRVGSEQHAHLRKHPRFVPTSPITSLSLRDGRRYSCRIADASVAGASVLTNAPAGMGDWVSIGSVPGRIVRITSKGFAVRFFELQPEAEVEAALNRTSAS